LEQCYANLGVKPDASKDEVKSAFRKLAIEVHPDTSELPKEEAEMRFKALSEAYDYIKTVNDWS
jgi:curved DNA-binding protein CbpA